MSRPRVTVITATYNWPGALRCAIETVLAQDFADFEYLIVGDCCTDETADVVASFKDPRIRWINLPENLGNQGDVHREAMKQARGDYVAYLNHDDLWFPDHLSVLVDAIETDEADIAHSLMLVIPPLGLPQRHLFGLPIHRAQKPPEKAEAHDEWFDGVIVWSVASHTMHRREAGERAGGWKGWREVRIGAPREFFRRIRLQHGRFSVAPVVTGLKFHAGQRPGSYVTKSSDEQENWLDRMRTDPDLRHRELALAFLCRTTREELPQFDDAAMRREDMPPGAYVEKLRRRKGLDPRLDIGDVAMPTTPDDFDTESAHTRLTRAAGGRTIMGWRKRKNA